MQGSSMQIIIIVKPNLIQAQVSPQEKIYTYMSRRFEISPQQIRVKISPTEIINVEDDFSKYRNPPTVAFYVTNLDGSPIESANSPLKNSTSIVQYGYCSQENDDPYQSRSQIINSAKSFNEEKLEMLNIISINLSSQNFDNINDSTPLIKNSKCEFCLKLVEETVIETPCQHFFDTQCFNLIIEAQILQRGASLKCICKKPLNLRIMLLLDNKYEAEAYKYKFLLNQLSSLEQTLRVKYGKEFRKCQNTKACNFFYLFQPQLQMKHQYCPYCLWQIDK